MPFFFLVVVVDELADDFLHSAVEQVIILRQSIGPGDGRRVGETGIRSNRVILVLTSVGHVDDTRYRLGRHLIRGLFKGLQFARTAKRRAQKFFLTRYPFFLFFPFTFVLLIKTKTGLENNIRHHLRSGRKYIHSIILSSCLRSSRFASFPFT